MNKAANERQVEILAPGGSYESIQAALSLGADAVYAGGGRFGARAYANNLDTEQMLRVIDEVHLQHKKLYLTVNTLLKPDEIENELIPYLHPFYEAGLDAILVQDFGVLKKVSEYFPQLSIHASTQMTVLSPEFTDLLKTFGVTRVVPARELSLEEIKAIKAVGDMEVETFVHGALCYCYSGQCLMSSMIGGRSGNRGRCAQPCRLPYRYERCTPEGLGTSDQKRTHPTYLLSLNDLCALDFIPDLVDAGIDSFKIEGRMKGAEYAALVSSLYRKYTDLYMQKGRESYRVMDEDREALMDMYNRGGFSKAYYFGHNDRHMITFRHSNHMGTQAATILGESNGVLKLKALEQLNRHDVLDIREGTGNQDTFSWTLGSDIKKGDTFSVRHRFRSKNHDTYCYRTRNDALINDVREKILKKSKEKIYGKVQIFKDLPVKMILTCGDISVEVTGQMPQAAQNRALTAEDIRRQISKTGDTPYVFETLDIELDESLFLPMGAFKELRRSAIALYEETLLNRFRRKHQDADITKDVTHVIDDLQKDVPAASDNLKEIMTDGLDGLYENVSDVTDGLREEMSGTAKMTVLVSTQEQWTAACRVREISDIYIDEILALSMKAETWQRSLDFTRACGKNIFLALPRILRNEAAYAGSRQRLLNMLDDVDGVLARSVEGVLLCRNKSFDGQIRLDASVYTWNNCAKDFWKQYGIEDMTVPEELNYTELKARGCDSDEMIVYGHRPLMTTAQCLTQTTGKCERNSQTKATGFLIDRKDKRMMVRRCCDFCYNMIYNSQVLELFESFDQIKTLGVARIRLEFTKETPEEMETVLHRYARAWYTGSSRKNTRADFTKGHFKRGVE